MFASVDELYNPAGPITPPLLRKEYARSVEEEANGRGDYHDARRNTMRKLTIALIVALAFVLMAGVAIARPAHTINCKGKYPCIGTPRGDTMLGTNGYDRINSKGGNDYVYAR